MLDFGCGAGQLVENLSALGYEVAGCDSWATYDQKPVDARLRKIGMEPYRLPFQDGEFDVVVSTSVFEHAQNKAECFREIHRVLKRGGYAMHVLPGKWYLPSEPHIYVPLANAFWPNCPRWWLALWAMLGVRNKYQEGMPWRTVVELNVAYCAKGLSYWSAARYRELSMEVYGNCAWPMSFHIEHAGGGFNALARKLPFRRFWGWVSRQFRMAFLVVRRED